MKRPTDIEKNALRAQVKLVRNQLRDFFVEAPAAMALLSGPDHPFVFANRAYLKMTGRGRNEIVGQFVKDALPELVDQGFLDLLNRVYQTGEVFAASEREVSLKRAGKKQTIYVDFTYFPMRDLAGEIEGILFQGIDVTEHVLARYELEKRVAYPWDKDSSLIMHSDGLATRWNFDQFPGLSGRHPALIAGVLYRDFCRKRDDVTILITRI